MSTPSSSYPFLLQAGKIYSLPRVLCLAGAKPLCTLCNSLLVWRWKDPGMSTGLHVTPREADNSNLLTPSKSTDGISLNAAVNIAT